MALNAFDSLVYCARPWLEQFNKHMCPCKGRMLVKKRVSMESFGTLEGLQQGTGDSGTSKVPRWQVVQGLQKDESARSPGLAFEARACYRTLVGRTV